MRKIFLIVGLFFPLTGLADCGLSITTNTAINIVWSSSFSSLAIPITVNKANNEACDFGIGINKGGAASYDARRVTVGVKSIPYQLYTNNGLSFQAKDYNNLTSSNDVIQGGFQTGTNLNQTVNYYLVIPYNASTNQALYGAGTFTDTYQVNIYLGNNVATYLTPSDSKNVTVTVTVDPMIALSLVSSGGSFQALSTNRNINFGTLYEGQSSVFDLILKTNAGYSVSVSSLNNGHLHSIGAGTTSLIPYRLYVNSANTNLASSATTPFVVLTGPGQTSNVGVANPFRVVIGSLSSVTTLGGNHADTITITATTTE